MTPRPRSIVPILMVNFIGTLGFSNSCYAYVPAGFAYGFVIVDPGSTTVSLTIPNFAIFPKRMGRQFELRSMRRTQPDPAPLLCPQYRRESTDIRLPPRPPF